MNNNLFIALILFLSVLLLESCNSDFEYNDNELNIENKIDQSTSLIDESVINAMNINEKAKEWSIELYKLRDNRAVWIKYDSLSTVISAFFNYVNSDTSLNIPFGYFSTPSFHDNSSNLDKEVITVLRCAEFLALKDTAIINFQKNTLNTSQRISVKDFMKFINEETKTESWVLRLLNYKENNKRLIQMHLAMNRFTDVYPIEENTAEKIPTDLKDSVLVHDFITHQLLQRNFIKDTVLTNEEMVIQLRSFQLLNGLNTDGKIGSNTVNALVETNYSRYLKGVIALDKTRSLPDSLNSGKLIIINIPSYLLHLYIDDEVINSSRVVVGTQSNQTPLFTATMKYIVVSPYWNVPYSIASKEILPNLKRDSSYLQRNRYSILDRNRNVLATDSIDWSNYRQSNFPFFVRQEPGPSNSLGLVKLMFPNDKSIYIHDTPSKYLFARDQRAFSHGCIRAEDPFRLVNDILSSEKHTYLDSVEVLKQRPKETYLILNERFPVTIVYHTAGINDSTQQVQFFNDIYKKEDQLYKLFDRPTQEK
jgi:hypothetical protein